VVKLAEGASSQELNAWLFTRGIVLSHLIQRKRTLENYFLELLKSNV
jgi:ABC-2 type transport system ATP-binding protein